MNKDTLQGQWKQIKGRVKERWGRFTDDDLKQIEGNLDMAAGRIQERYGHTRERAEREWNEFCDTCSRDLGKQEEV
ncbi:MAG: CsbD family protein [Planctomycetes bacterium]|nr:CsbD family protein [Planctomycetota bacterium]